MRKYVVSTTMESADWKNSTIIKDDVAGEVVRSCGTSPAATLLARTAASSR